MTRRKRARSRLDELTERTRQEARALSRNQRAEARRRRRAGVEGLDGIGFRMRGTALESRRRLRPVVAPVGRLFARSAPYVTGALLFAIKLLAAVIALILELAQVTLSWLATRLTAAARLTGWLRVHVTPLPTVALVGVVAAVGLGVSQFFDYHGVAVDAPNYAGEVGAVAPAPITDTETAGDAHLWILLPVAAAALVLVLLAYRGRTRAAAGIVVCGLLGLAVALAIDLPQGLDAGRAGLAFSGAQAVLLEGFWAEVACSAVLLLCGGLLPLYSRGVARARRGRPAGRRRRVAREDAGGISPGLQAES